MAETDNTKLRFAIMCNTMVLQQWQYDALELLINSGKASLVAVILRDGESLARPGLLKRVLKYPWTKLLFRQYYRYIFRPSVFRPADFSNLAGDKPRLYCRVEVKRRYSEYFSESDIDSIRKLEPDFILKFGFGIVRGEILNCALYGIWSFHHGDEQKYRGVPPAFYEILYNDPVTGAIFQRLTETLDGGLILRKGYFPTIAHSWSANLDQAITLSKRWPVDVCNEIITQQTFPLEAVGGIPKAPVYKEPANMTFTIFLIKQLFNKIKFHFREILYTEKWQTGLVKTRAANLISDLGYIIDNVDVTWIKTDDRDRYFADSFALKDDGRLLLMFEDYNYKLRKAEISSVWFSEREDSVSEVVQVLAEPWHLSYPFLFREEDNIYCMPESLHHGSVELYKFDVISGKLVHHKTLLPGIAAADATLVQHQNRWYLFFTPAHATNVELNIWHSDSLDEPFEPHELNPVKADIANARPAGPFFMLDGKLYRPAQDCSRTYGAQVIINEVKLLTGKEFLEMPVSTLSPPKGFSGLHTISFAGDYLYFDCKEHVYSPASFKWQLKRRLRLVKSNPNPVR